MKRVIALILAGMLVFSLAACGGNETAETTTAAPETTAAPATGLLVFRSSTLLLTPKGEQEYELMKLSISYPKDALKG